jgi:hypothetical protein
MYSDIVFESQKEKALCLERWQQCLRVLRSLTKHEREHHFDMATWGEKNDCGTTGCAAGHCSLDPWFRKRGLRLGFNDHGGGDWVGKYDDPDPFFIYGFSLFYQGGTYIQVVKKIVNLIRDIRDMDVYDGMKRE